MKFKALLFLMCLKIGTLWSQETSYYLFVGQQVETDRKISTGVLVAINQLSDLKKEGNTYAHIISITEIPEELWACCVTDTVSGFGLDIYGRGLEAKSTPAIDSTVAIYQSKLEKIGQKQTRLVKVLKKGYINTSDGIKLYACKVSIKGCPCQLYGSVGGNWQYVPRIFIEQLFKVEKLNRQEIKYMRENFPKHGFIFKH